MKILLDNLVFEMKIGCYNKQIYESWLLVLHLSQKDIMNTLFLQDLELLPLQNNVNVYGYGPYLQGIRTDLWGIKS